MAKAQTGTYSVPAMTGTSSAPGHLTDTSSAPSQGSKPHLSASGVTSARLTPWHC